MGTFVDIPQDVFLSELPRISKRESRARFLDSHPELINQAAVTRLGDLVREQAKIDTGPVIPLAETAVSIARRLGDKRAVAQSLRAKANALYLCGQNKSAVLYHEKAGEIFVKLSDTTELARTLSASIQPLILLGEYERAFSAADKARKIFTKEGNEWRLARVELNAGNILHRQDRFAEALEHYQRAYSYFTSFPEKDPEAVAVALHNMAMCLVALNDFPRALKTHEEARRFALEHGMHLLVGQADYNIASLHYLRGEHTVAIEMLRSTKKTCAKANDVYHVALCNLDLSDIYLELNQAKEAGEMAQEAAQDFQRLHLGYEAGRALANSGLALWQQGEIKSALSLFDRARKLFVTERNRVWPSRMDLYHATILLDQRQYSKGRRLCQAALKALQKSRVPSSLIACRLLLAQLYLDTRNVGLALRQANAALKLVRSLELPALRCQAQLLVGKIRTAMGQPSKAYQCYDDARQILEALRTSLNREELRTSFMKNRLEIYHSLIELCVDMEPKRLEEAFEHIEQSKSRSMRDLMFRSRSEFQVTSQMDPALARKIQDLRAEINWYSHKWEEEQQGKAKVSPSEIAHLQSEIRKREDKLLRIVREMPLPVAEAAGLVTPKPVTVKEVRALLSPDSTLLEYFQLRDQFAVAALSQGSLDIVPLAPTALVNELVTHLHFQLSKFRLGTEYVAAFGKSLMESSLQHLEKLHGALIEPIQKLLRGNRLVVVPHGALHSLPFQALFDGQRYLIDSFCISYAPSATIMRLCRTRTPNSGESALVLGIPDVAAPSVLDEAKTVAATLPGSSLFLNEKATAKQLRIKGEHSRFIHIATHGYFRQDNPMFSGIRLGDRILSLYDLYQMKLPAELITLSGCATGLSVVEDGDELLGLLRGLIYAGASSAMLTLWDVQDRSTSEFMALFYKNLSSGDQRASALQKAAIALRESYPHPYYWAPFVLLGG